ncbi:hypothetical protein [Mycobacterium lepromatosis]|uniref:hypothetical protein n=1 Tax=Mycobacterium lepromatosis TaxID=480418 RepID=UPI0006786C5A|nr:hypothetical protein [Mycobacterium lepromatosis]
MGIQSTTLANGIGRTVIVTEVIEDSVVEAPVRRSNRVDVLVNDAGSAWTLESVANVDWEH